jgi:hypothetical protein
MASFHAVSGVARRYPLATICVALSGSLLIGLFFRFDALGEASASLTQQEAEGKRIEKNLLNAASLERDMASLAAGLAKLEAKLIRADDVGTNQQYFYELVSTTGVKLSVLRPQGLAKSKIKGKVSATNYQPFGYNVVVEGSFSQAVAFLQTLEAGGRHFRLVDYTMQRATQGQDTGANIGNVVLNLNLELLASS